jgi:hypothetical protein
MSREARMKQATPDCRTLDKNFTTIMLLQSDSGEDHARVTQIHEAPLRTGTLSETNQ